MNIEMARQSVGLWVMSRDAGFKLIPSVSKAHGPYQIEHVTKAGLVILAGRDDGLRVKPSLLELANCTIGLTRIQAIP